MTKLPKHRERFAEKLFDEEGELLDFFNYQKALISNVNLKFINDQEDDDDTYLHYACKCGLLDYAEFLLKNGADVNIKNNDLRTALDYAEENEDQQMIALIKKYKRR